MKEAIIKKLDLLHFTVYAVKSGTPYSQTRVQSMIDDIKLNRFMTKLFHLSENSHDRAKEVGFLRDPIWRQDNDSTTP